MAHRKLFPKPGSDYLSPPEVVARLRFHFRHVQIDPQGGQTHVDNMFNQFARMQFLTPPRPPGNKSTGCGGSARMPCSSYLRTTRRARANACRPP